MGKMSWLPLIAGMCVLATAGCSIDVSGEESVVTEEKRFTVTASPELDLETFDGPIEIKSWDRNEVLIRIDRRAPNQEEAKSLEVRTTQDGNRIVVDAERRFGGSRRRDLFHIGPWWGTSVRLVVSAPRQVTLNARTGDGGILAESLSGAISLQSGDGDIRARSLEGDIRAHTGDGSIELSDARGRVDLDSGDGAINVGGRLETLRVLSGDGRITVEVSDGSAMKEDWSVTSGDGPITLRVPATFDAEVDAQSGDGAIRIEGVDTVERDDDDRGFVRTQLGKGGRVVRLRSGDGRIDVSRR